MYISIRVHFTERVTRLWSNCWQQGEGNGRSDSYAHLRDCLGRRHQIRKLQTGEGNGQDRFGVLHDQRLRAAAPSLCNLPESFVDTSCRLIIEMQAAREAPSPSVQLDGSGRGDRAMPRLLLFGHISGTVAMRGPRSGPPGRDESA